MINPIYSFANSIDTQKLRVHNLPSLIFLCGGFAPDIHSQSNPVEYESVRHYMYEHITNSYPKLKPKIWMAEDVNDWFREDYFSDLVTFEKQVASLASVIVVFVESPGSIAELASFSQIPQIQKRLLVFLDTYHYQQNSFIRQGPIQFLEKNTPGLVHVYRWSSNNSSGNKKFELNLLKRHANPIVDTINAKVASSPNQETFLTSNETHLTLLVCDMLEIAKLLKVGEIVKIMQEMEINAEQRDIKKYLFILEKLNLVEEVQYGNHRYYRCKDEANFISYGYKAKANTNDRTRWKYLISKWVKEKDKDRFRAIQSSVS